MKNLLITTLLIISSLNAITNISVTIEPQKRVIEAIGGELVAVNVMVKAGDDPHTYEPKPSQMVKLATSDIYFSIGLEFEDVWLQKFNNLNPKMLISDLSIGIKKLDFNENHHHDHEHGSKDPHIWTSPQNLKLMALNAFVTLSIQDPSNKDLYETNLNKFLHIIDSADITIKGLLNGRDKTFMVFHPSWNYFTEHYHLNQIVVEVEGKEPKPKELVAIIQKARKQGAHIIFTQPEFSSKSARIIAKELNIAVIPISNLVYNIETTLIEFARYISQEKK